MRPIAATIGAILPASLWARQHDRDFGGGVHHALSPIIDANGRAGHSCAACPGKLFRRSGGRVQWRGGCRLRPRLGFPVARAAIRAYRARKALNHRHCYPCDRLDDRPDPGQSQPAARSRRGAGAREGMAARLLEASAAAVVGHRPISASPVRSVRSTCSDRLRSRSACSRSGYWRAILSGRCRR